MEVDDLVISTATAGLDLQREDGSFPAGQNGPYGNEDTPARNTSHWAITMIDAYERSGEQRFLDTARRSLKYLCSDAIRPNAYSFKHREREYEGQDQANGLVGQAWTIEALATAAKHIEDEMIIDTAVEVFLAHPFDPALGLWKHVDIDGSVQGYHMTFNQHLWFAAAGSLLASTMSERDHADTDTVQNRVRQFMANVESNIHTFPSGLIVHPMLPAVLRREAASNLEYQRQTFDKWKRIAFFKTVNAIKDRTLRNIVEKSRPYHPFNLYALAILYRQNDGFDFWESNTFEKVLGYSKRPSLIDAVSQNKYGYDYNPVGFELGVAWATFDGRATKRSDEAVASQLQNSYDPEASLMKRSECDPETHMARFYEVTRYPGTRLEVTSLELD